DSGSRGVRPAWGRVLRRPRSKERAPLQPANPSDGLSGTARAAPRLSRGDCLFARRAALEPRASDPRYGRRASALGAGELAGGAVGRFLRQDQYVLGTRPAVSPAGSRPVIRGAER